MPFILKWTLHCDDLMLDTFTLLLVTILQFEVVGFALLIVWFTSTRARDVLGVGVGGATLLLVAMVLLPVWVYWSRGELYFASINIVVLAIMVIVPCGVVLSLACRIVRLDTHLRAARLKKSGPSHDEASALAHADALEHELRAAMQGVGQLFVAYQPIFSAAERRVLGFEALVRWHHPERGMISPATFIEVAEQSQLIVPLGAWVLETACMEAAAWPEPLYISVNLSPVQLARGNVVREVDAALIRSGLAPRRLELEVTESMMVSAGSSEIGRLVELRRHGVKVAIDDFGTGYSSLGYLRQMPFDTLKIDRSFVSSLEEDSGARAIVSTVIELSHRLDCQVVAEGVETEGQFTILNDLRCHRVQGWLLGKPMTAEALRQTFFAADPGGQPQG